MGHFTAGVQTDLFAATLHALLPPFLIILIGQALKRVRVLHASYVPVMNGLVMNVSMPALILVQLATGPVPTLHSFLLPACLIVTELVLIGLAMMAGRLARLHNKQLGTILLTSAFGNTGYLGYPICLALLPRQFPAAVLMDQFSMGIPMYIIAAFVGARYGMNGHAPGAPPEKGASPADAWKPAIVRFLKSPLFIALMTGLTLRVIRWPPEFLSAPPVHNSLDVVGHCLTTIGQATIPLVLLALGVTLRPAMPERISPFAISLVLKLFGSPILFWALARAVGIRGELLEAAVLMAAMPAAAMSAVLSAQYEMDGDMAVGIVFLTTTLSAITVPLMLSILR